MAYSDLQSRAFTQIAYMDLDEKYVDYCKANGTDSAPLSEILSTSQYEKLINLGLTDAEINLWNISGVHNTNSQNGFYACIIETAPGEAAVGFRGSEGAKRGEETTWDILTSKFSQGIDHMPKIIGGTLVGTVSALIYGGIWMSQEMFKDGEITPFGATVIAVAATFVITFGPIKTVALVTTILFVAVVAFFAVVAYEYAYELIEYIVNEVIETVTEFCDWLKDKAHELKEFVAKGLGYLKNWFKNNFNSGYKYANFHPQIKVDTYKLRDYASRIYAVNRRISSLDGRMDSLYWRVELLDLWNLMQADILTGYSWRLSRCASYLSDTATDFVNAENDLVGKLQ